MVPNNSPCSSGELLEVGESGHRAIVVHDLGQHPGRVHPGQFGQIDGGLGVPGSLQNPAGLVSERVHVTGTGQVLGPGRRVDHGLDGPPAIGRRDPGRGAFTGIDRHREGGPANVGVAGNHHRQVELVETLADHGKADDPAGVTEHEPDLGLEWRSRRP